MFNLFRRKLQVPEKKVLIPSQFTADIAILEQYQTQLLFVADEWMRDRRGNFVLDDEGVERKGRAFTMPHFNYRVFGGELEPQWEAVPLRDKTGFKIQGEIVSISPSLFLKLDKLKLNGVQFRRERIRIIQPYRDSIVFENTIQHDDPLFRGGNYASRGIDWATGKFPHGHPLSGKKLWVSKERLAFIWAWMYVAIPSYWKMYANKGYLFHKVPTFKPKKDKSWWLTEYYRYQNPKE